MITLQVVTLLLPAYVLTALFVRSVFSLAPEPQDHPVAMITHKFSRILLRHALYTLSRNTDSTVSWELTKTGFPRGD